MPDSSSRKLLGPFARARFRRDPFMVAVTTVYTGMFAGSIIVPSMRVALIPIPGTSGIGLPALVIVAYIMSLAALIAHGIRIKRTSDGESETVVDLRGDKAEFWQIHEEDRILDSTKSTENRRSEKLRSEVPASYSRWFDEFILHVRYKGPENGEDGSSGERGGG